MTWNRSVPLRQMVQPVTPAALIASVSSAGTAAWACSYSTIRSPRTVVCSATLMAGRPSWLAFLVTRSKGIPQGGRDVKGAQRERVGDLGRAADTDEHAGDRGVGEREAGR